MIFEFTLNENDFLTFNLFVASKSERIKKRRLRSRLAAPIVQAAFGLVFLFDHKILPGIIFLAFAPVWYFIYPLWEKKYYTRSYTAFIRENMGALINKTVSLEFTDDFILAKESGNEGKIAYSEMESIHEIPSTIFIRLKGGKAFIIPKDQISNLEALKSILKELALVAKVNYEIDEKWEWK